MTNSLSLRQCHFLNVTPFSAFCSVDVLKKEQAVTHLINVKAFCFHSYLKIMKVDVFSVVAIGADKSALPYLKGLGLLSL